MLDTNNYLAYDKRIKSIEYNKPGNSYDQYWYIIDNKNRILYFKYNTCLDKNDKKATKPLQDVGNYPYYQAVIDN